MQPGADGALSARKSRLGWVIAPLLIFAALVAVFAFALKTGDPSKLPSALIGKPAPATQFAPLDGLVEDGKPVPGFTSSRAGQRQCERRQLLGVVVHPVRRGAAAAGRAAEAHRRRPLRRQLQGRCGVGAPLPRTLRQSVHGRRHRQRRTRGDRVGRLRHAGDVRLNGKGEIVFKHVGPISPESMEKRLMPAIAKAQAATATPAVPQPTAP